MRAIYQRFFDAMVQERLHQAHAWGDGDDEVLDARDDAKNDQHSFVSYIAHYSTGWFNRKFGPLDEVGLRAYQVSMVKVATLAMSAYAWADRRLQRVVADHPREMT